MPYGFRNIKMTRTHRIGLQCPDALWEKLTVDNRKLWAPEPVATGRPAARGDRKDLRQPHPRTKTEDV